jgi:hypothetical protein
MNRERLPNRRLAETFGLEDTNRHLVEVPDTFAIARWRRDADVVTICRCILGTLKFEPHVADTTPLRRALEGVIEREGAAPVTNEEQAFWREMARMPDLQKLVERAGRRYAASIGEVYDENPDTRPKHQGGHKHITPQEWARWDAANAEFKAKNTHRSTHDD